MAAQHPAEVALADVAHESARWSARREIGRPAVGREHELHRELEQPPRPLDDLFPRHAFAQPDGWDLAALAEVDERVAGYVVPASRSMFNVAAADWNTSLAAACFLACPPVEVAGGNEAEFTPQALERRILRRRKSKAEEGTPLERLSWDCGGSRTSTTARILHMAGGAPLALTVLAVAGVAATLAPGPNGCPTNKSLKTAPIADLAPPARTQIEAFDVLSGPINEQTQTFTLKVRVGSTCSGINIKGASVYVTAVPYNQFSIPAEELTGDDGTATLVFRRDANFPASSKQQQLTLFIRATKPGEDNGDLAGVSTRRLVAVNFSQLTPVS